MARVKQIPWWQWIPLPWRRWRLVGNVDAGDEVPHRLPRKGVVLVGPPDSPTWAAFDCPCAQGHRLMVNLDQRRRPAWRVESLSPLSIRPSLDDITPTRRCHFFISRGRITWARDGPREIR
jgi:hypothetical protein